MKRDFLRVCGDCGGLEGRRYGVGAGRVRLVVFLVRGAAIFFRLLDKRRRFAIKWKIEKKCHLLRGGKV